MWRLVLMVLVLPRVALAGDVRLERCGHIAFGDCLTVEAPVPEPEAPLALPAPPQWPYFTRENMAPDTPELLLKGLNEPTLASARAFYAWQQERFRRMQAFQHLLNIVAKEKK
jgi:hypothetical protein